MQIINGDNEDRVEAFRRYSGMVWAEGESDKEAYIYFTPLTD